MIKWLKKMWCSHDRRVLQSKYYKRYNSNSMYSNGFVDISYGIKVYKKYKCNDCGKEIEVLLASKSFFADMLLDEYIESIRSLGFREIIECDE